MLTRLSRHSPDTLLSDILKEAKKTSKDAGLMGFETIKKCLIDTSPFGVENNLLTPTMKLRRPQLINKYKDRLLKLYDEEEVKVEVEVKPPRVPNMWKNQASLPRLPLPSVENSMKLFLEVAEPIVDKATFEMTKKAAEDFLKQDAKALQEQLKAIDDRAAPDSSWFADFHKGMYMKARYPVYVHKNPGGGECQQVVR